MTLLGRSLRRGLGGSLAALLGAVAVGGLSVPAPPVAQASPGAPYWGAGGTARGGGQGGTHNPGHGPRGDWMAATDGGGFPYGNAQFKGSSGALNKPIVGIATTPLGNGYWMAASDGGIFAFNVPFPGSTGGIKLNQPVVAIIASPLGDGYWLAASDRGLVNFGRPPPGPTA